MMLQERRSTVIPSTGHRVKRASESSDAGSPRRGGSDGRKFSASVSGNTPAKTDLGKRVKFKGNDKKERHGTLR